MKKRILVTGAAGFIGYHLCQALHKRGDFVVGLDNFNAYYDRRLKQARADALQKNRIEVLTGDIVDKERLAAIVRSQQITHIAHLAAQAGVRYSLENPHAYTATNIEGFLNILEVCRQQPEIRLCYASSSSVYGENKKIPFSENDPADHPVSLYGATKKSNELFAAAYHRLFGIAVTGLRYFTVYGPWGRPDMAYYSFAKAIANEEPIPVFNFGKMIRDFTYIDDIVAGTVAAIDLEAGCDIFNLGNNSPCELIRFIEILENAMGKRAKLEFLPMQKGDVEKTFADIEKSKRMLHFHPKTTLETGLQLFAEWFTTYHSE